MRFTLSKAVNPSKVFIEQKTNVTGRWDPFYFRPELVALEKRVRKVTSHRLRQFVHSMSGGATPSTAEAETHYTESDEGVPFIRVQNLSTTGRLNLNDCKRITRSTHEGLLKRSRLSGGELLVKITGVGRMAVASVVPEGFEGNINQHIVAIRTKDIATSETLAAYLNLDMAERLASRRSTGGTRPALDYPALLSIPVVFDKQIPELMQAAVKQHQEQIKKAEALLTTIDDVLLDELGIPRKPEPPNTIESRIFEVKFSATSGQRLNPDFHRDYFRQRHQQLDACSHPTMLLRSLHGAIFQGVGRNIVDGAPITLLKVKNITTNGEIDFTETEPVGDVPFFKRLRRADIITPFIGEAIKLHKFAMFSGQPDFFTVDNNTGVIRVDDGRIAPEYLLVYLRSELVRWQLQQLTGGGGVPFLGSEYAGRLRIVIPSPEIQERVCRRVAAIRDRARALRKQAHADLEKAKRDIEALILGKEVKEHEKARVANLETVQEKEE